MKVRAYKCPDCDTYTPSVEGARRPFGGVEVVCPECGFREVLAGQKRVKA